MRQKILDFGVRKLDIPAPHLYRQAPDGQVYHRAPNDMVNGWGLKE
jgi:hypothetical protein